MEWFIDNVFDKFEIGLAVLFALLAAAAIIRTVLKAVRGERLDVPPVGVINDLPGSVTGISKYDDRSERAQERHSRKTD